MFIRKKSSPHNKNKVSVQIVESVRTGDKISQTILRHVGTSENEEELQKLLELAETIKARLEEEKIPSLPLFEVEKIIKTPEVVNDAPLNVDLKKLREDFRFNEGILDVFGELYDLLGFNKIFTGRFAETNNSILRSCVMARIANPSSKLRTSELLEQDFAIRLPVDKIYRMMSQLEGLSDKIKATVKNSTLNLLNQKVSILFFDVTTLYFESFSEDELRSFGFSKDCKFKETQVVFALITTTNGLPITYEVFPGKTAETTTLLPVIKKLKETFNIESIEFAADRGMFSEKNLLALEEEKIEYVVAAKLMSMDKKTQEAILKINDNNDKNSYRELELKHKGRRLILTYNPIRASKDKKDRERLVERIRKIADVNGDVGTKKLIKNGGTKKYLKFSDEKKDAATINEEKIKSESAWDGIAGYVSNSEKSIGEVVGNYKRLWEIEESFRINKHDLKLRPIFHHSEDRIKAHLDICFITYALVRQIMYRHEVQQRESISFAVIRNALLQVQASVFVDASTKKRYIIPSNASPLAKKLYQILGLKRSLVPYEMPQK